MAFLPKGWGKKVAEAEATIPRERIRDGDVVDIGRVALRFEATL